MTAAQLAVTGSAALAAAAVFAGASLALLRRPVSASNRAPALSFAAWWALLALQATTDGGRVLLGLRGAPDPTLFTTLVVLKILAAGAAVAAMTHYLLHLWGRPRGALLLAVPLGFVHAAVFLYLFLRRFPATVEAGEWTTRLVLAGPPLLNAYAQLLGTTHFFLPSLVFALAYLVLWRRAHDRTSRARLLGIALALLVFHAAAIVQFDPDRSDTVLTPLFSVANAFTAALVLLTYWPPRWAQRRWGLEPVTGTRGTG